MAKSRARPTTGASTQPGAVSASGGGASLNQLESDVMAKSRARPTTGASAQPGAVSASGGGASLNQLESDVMAKSRARPTTGVAVERLGFVSVTGAASLSQLEEDVQRKGHSERGRAQPNLAVSGTGAASLNQLEEDVAAKSRGQKSAGPAIAGVFEEGGAMRGQTSLEQMEEEVTSKARSGPPAHMPGSVAAAGGHQDAKPRGRTQEQSNTARSAAAFASLQSLEEEVVGTRGRYGEQPPQDDASLELDEGPELYSIRDGYQDSFASRHGQLDDAGDGDSAENEDVESPAMADPEQPGNNTQEVSTGQAGGIEAFVADTVVTATSAFVVSEDEGQDLDKRRVRRFRYCVAGSVVVAIVVVIVAVVLSRGNDGGDTMTKVPLPPTAAPSYAPSSIPSSAPTTEELADFLGFIKFLDPNNEDYYDEVFSDIGSPQYQAALWSVNEDLYPTSGFADPSFVQRFALATFYFATIGDLWVKCDRNDEACAASGEVTAWLSNNDECTWDGLECGVNGVSVNRMVFCKLSMYIVRIQPNGKLTIPFSAPEISSPNIAGTLPHELIFLTGLQILSLEENIIGGSIPEGWSVMSNLRSVRLADNRLSGTFPEHLLANNPNLSILRLGNNTFYGTLPDTFSGPLRNIELEHNKFNGTIPTQLGSLLTLRKFCSHGHV